MSNEPSSNSSLSQSTRPKLATKARLQVDPVTGKPMILYPEGVVMLNETGAAILRLCDGTRTFRDIVSELAQQYAVTTDTLQQEVREYLLGLHKRSLLELLPE